MLFISTRTSAFLGGLVLKNLSANAGSIQGSGGAPRGLHGNPLQYWDSSCLKNPIDREAWQATVHGVPKGWT